MPLLVLLLPAERIQTLLGPETIETLSGLGVTSVSVARDDESVAFVLDGWAFDRHNQRAALEAIGATAEGTRALELVMQTALAARREAGERWTREDTRHATGVPPTAGGRS